MKLTARWRLLCGLTAITFLAAACGSDDDSAAATTAAAATTEAPDTTEAADTTVESSAAPESSAPEETTPEEETTVPEEVDLLADGDPCTGLEPRPLAEPATVKVARSAIIEAFSQVYLAESQGEFAAENLEIEFVDAAVQADGLVLLSTGDVDVMPTSPTAGFFNATAGGSVMKVVAPIFIAPEGSKTGMWLSSDILDGATVEDFDYSKLAGTTIAVTGGAGTPGSLMVHEVLKKGGLTFDDVTIEQFGAPDSLIALENGAVAGANLLDPFWIEADKGDYAESVFPQPSEISLGGTLFGERLLNEDREIGEAFIRAYARTTCTYLQGDYHKDPDVLAALAEALGVPEENLAAAPSLNFDPWLGMSPGLTDTLQEVYLLQGVLAFGEADLIPEEDVVDREFVESVIGT